MPSKLTRSTSVDSALLRPVVVKKNLSQLASNLRSVNTVPVAKPAATDPTSKFELLKFRNQYRESVATNFMSSFSEDFKLAYEAGDKVQKRNLENIAVAIYLAQAEIIRDKKDDTAFKEAVSGWLTAIKEGHKDPNSNFTNEANFNVHHKNKARENYLKAVNKLGNVLKEAFLNPKQLAKAAMCDIRQRCSDVLEHHGIDITQVQDFLQQAAFNAEKNMCDALENLSMPGKEGTAFLQQSIFHVNSMLNYPNYLREVIAKAEKPAEQTPPPQQKNDATPASNENSVPLGRQDQVPPASNGYYPPAAPVVNLSNIGNPVINIDLADKFERLEKLLEKGTNVYHIHNYNICRCQHALGSSAEPHNLPGLMHFTANENAYPALDRSSEFIASNVELISSVHPDAQRMNNNTALTGSSTSQSVSIDQIDGAASLDVVENLHSEDINVENNAQNFLQSTLSESANSSGIINDSTGVDSDRAVSDTDIPVSSEIHSQEATNDIDTKSIADATLSVRNRTAIFEKMFNNIPDSTKSLQPQGQPVTASRRPLPHIDSFIAKEERAGRGVTLSQTGLLRPNIPGADSITLSARQAELGRTENSLNETSKNKSSFSTSEDIDLTDTVNDTEKLKSFVSTASIMLQQPKRGIEFNNLSRPQQLNRTASSLQDATLPKSVSHVQTVASDINDISDENIKTVQFNNAINFSDPGVSNTTSQVFATDMTSQRETFGAPKTRPYSPYLDESGKPRPRIVTTVDGLHPSKY
ncbi:hypothetical protein AC791_14290 [Klebsiella sp. RIT-PI-d]|uniref:hypothetical protein n=1 Tax=Klebsiella sp. RIT-PI-d TaxID=1681196 RepID=UPI00067617ED|nr:hypothetical protein [Klebsiella sp. RIT-PI-d]KNC09788.1 hypothetical protein AC791_14290 [Klebsiella sp. RIT-PI-d]